MIVGSARADESGVVGGFEVLPFGFLVLVAGTLLIVNAWGVVDAKVAASAAAREAARAFVESTAATTAGALAEAEAAAVDAVVGHGRDPARMSIATDGPVVLERCAPAAFVVSYRVPTVAIPWIGGFGDGFVTASARHREVVDPFRDGVPSGATSGAVTC